MKNRKAKPAKTAKLAKHVELGDTITENGIQYTVVYASPAKKQSSGKIFWLRDFVFKSEAFGCESRTFATTDPVGN